MDKDLIQDDLLSINTSTTRVIFGWEEGLNVRNHAEIMTKELQEYFYIEDELFLLVTKSLTNTEYYKKFIKNLGPSKIIICTHQNPGLLELAEIFSAYRENKKRVIVGLGGGSVMDLAKAVAGWAYHPSFIPVFPLVSEALPCYPLLLIPTIAGSGSEVSPYIVMTDKQGCKVTNGLVPPYLSIVDPAFSISAPLYQTLYAVLIAFSQAIEAFVSTGGTKETDRLAFRAIELIIYYLNRVLTNKEDKESRSNLSLASVFSGLSKKAGLGLATGIGQQIHNLPYGLILSLLLPSIIKFNSGLCNEKYYEINNLFVYRNDNLADTIQNWFQYLGVYSFKGIYRKNIEVFLQSEYCIRLAGQLILESLHYKTNPRKASPEEIKKLLFSLYTIPLQPQTDSPFQLF